MGRAGSFLRLTGRYLLAALCGGLCCLLLAGCKPAPMPVEEPSSEVIELPSEHRHTPTDPTVALSPSCTAEGIRAIYCAECGELLESSLIPVTAHLQAEPVLCEGASCEAGYQRFIYCADCGELLQTEDLPPHPHTEGDYTETRAPSCVTLGEQQTNCTECGSLLQKDLPSLGHDPGDWQVQSNPTCTKDGKDVRKCKRCGEAVESRSVAKLGHRSGEKKLERSAGCVTAGSYIVPCTRCGKTVDRISIPATGHQWNGHVCTVCHSGDSVAESMPYQPGVGAYRPHTENTPIPFKDYALSEGLMGYRIFLVQKALGLNDMGRYRDSTVSAVKRFQRQNGLKVTGQVTREDFIAMGYTDSVWESGDTFVSRSQYTESKTRQELVDIFVETAKSYIGTRYIYGASAPKGLDCSGLVLQCLYSVGIQPEGYDSQQHNFNEYNSRLMYKDPHFRPVNYADRQPGDLVFYDDYAGTIIHVAVYIGNDQTVDGWRSGCQIRPLEKDTMRLVAIKRVLYY